MSDRKPPDLTRDVIEFLLQSPEHESSLVRIRAEIAAQQISDRGAAPNDYTEGEKETLLHLLRELIDHPNVGSTRLRSVLDDLVGIAIPAAPRRRGRQRTGGPGSRKNSARGVAREAMRNHIECTLLKCGFSEHANPISRAELLNAAREACSRIPVSDVDQTDLNTILNALLREYPPGFLYLN